MSPPVSEKRAEYMSWSSWEVLNTHLGSYRVHARSNNPARRAAALETIADIERAMEIKRARA